MSATAKAAKKEESVRNQVQEMHEALKSMNFEEFREATTNMFIAHWGAFEAMIPSLAKDNRKFQEDLLKVMKKENRKEMDAAFKAYESLKDRTIMLEWSMYCVMVLFRKYVMHEILTDEDRRRIAALFLIDLEAIRKNKKADLLWRLLEKETRAARTKEDLDHQKVVDAYNRNPKAFTTYFEILQSGDRKLIDLLNKGSDRIKRGMDADEDPKTVAADLTKMLEDFKPERQEASHDSA